MASFSTFHWHRFVHSMHPLESLDKLSAIEASYVNRASRLSDSIQVGINA